MVLKIFILLGANLLQMRILITLKALDDMLYDLEYYTKLQGFFYRLFYAAGFVNVHNKKGYKYFSFSNIFPVPADFKIKKGEIKKIIFASPNSDYVKAIAEVLRELYLKQEIGIGFMRFAVEDIKVYRAHLRDNMLIRTATPVIIRVPQSLYDQINVDNAKLKPGFVYWRPELGKDVFVRLVERNLNKKFCSYYGDCNNRIRFIDAYKLVKAPVVVKFLVNGVKKINLTGSMWEFYYPKVSGRIKQLSFMLDAGIGERNSYGFGFLNILKT